MARKKKSRVVDTHWKPFGVKLREEDKELLTQAATYRGLPVSAFIREAALERAHEVLDIPRAVPVENGEG